ncbi:MAG: hypothetical protein SAMD01599839_18460 [Rectinema sp.]
MKRGRAARRSPKTCETGRRSALIFELFSDFQMGDSVYFRFGYEHLRPLGARTACGGKGADLV